MSGNSARFFRKAKQVFLLAWAFACLGNLCFPPALSAQVWDDNIVSKRVRIRIPVDRQWLGRESVNDLERGWQFIDAASGGKLPSRVLVVVQWQDALSSLDVERATISIGMNDSAATTDPKGFLLHAAVREMARMSLIGLSGGGAAREENRFLLEGMSEMLARDFSNTVNRITASWAISYYLDRINPLGWNLLASRPELSGPVHDLRSASPGITFLTTCRELYGRERLLKLFESLAKKNLEESVSAVFRTTIAKLEAEWWTRVRAYKPAELTITTNEEAPALDRIALVPDPGKPGAALGLLVYARDATNDLSSAGIFLVDETSGRVLQGKPVNTPQGRCTRFEMPVEPERQDGRYRLQLVAVDEGGNLRLWEANYLIAR
jgi:hypothetical protein